MRSSFPLSVSLGLVALLSLSGCGFSGASGKSSQAADPDQRIVVDNFRAPVADWALESDAAYILSLSGCLETLTRYDESQGKIVPSLATEWKQVSALEWDFKIREGVKFQDGTALDAEAVVGLPAERPRRRSPRPRVQPQGGQRRSRPSTSTLSA